MIVQNIKDVFAQENWSKIGEDIIGGITTGAKSKEMELANQLVKNAKSLIGVPTGNLEKQKNTPNPGMIQGLKDYMNLAINASSNLGFEVREALKASFSNIFDTLNGDPSLSPTITPVIDLTNVEKDLNTTLSKNRTINVSGVATKASNAMPTSKSVGDNNSTSTQVDNTKNVEVNVVNNFTVRNNDDIRKISVDLKSTLDRYTLAKGVAVG